MAIGQKILRFGSKFNYGQHSKEADWTKKVSNAKKSVQRKNVINTGFFGPIGQLDTYFLYINMGDINII